MLDIHLSDEWNFEEDTVQGNMSLYEKWVEDTSGDMVLGNEEQKCCFRWWILLLIPLIIVLLLIKRKKKHEEGTK